MGHELPAEMLYQIFLFLTPKELVVCCRVCNVWNNVITNFDYYKFLKNFLFPINKKLNTKIITNSDIWKDLSTDDQNFHSFLSSNQIGKHQGGLSWIWQSRYNEKLTVEKTTSSIYTLYLTNNALYSSAIKSNVGYWNLKGILEKRCKSFKPPFEGGSNVTGFLHSNDHLLIWNQNSLLIANESKKKMSVFLQQPKHTNSDLEIHGAYFHDQDAIILITNQFMKAFEKDSTWFETDVCQQLKITAFLKLENSLLVATDGIKHNIRKFDKNFEQQSFISLSREDFVDEIIFDYDNYATISRNIFTWLNRKKSIKIWDIEKNQTKFALTEYKAAAKILSEDIVCTTDTDKINLWDIREKVQKPVAEYTFKNPEEKEPDKYDPLYLAELRDIKWLSFNKWRLYCSSPLSAKFLDIRNGKYFWEEDYSVSNHITAFTTNNRSRFFQGRDDGTIFKLNPQTCENESLDPICLPPLK